MLSQLLTAFKKIKPYWLTMEATCLLCLAPIKQSTAMICTACKQDLPIITQGCECCGLPLTYQGRCGQCLKQPPCYQQIIAPYRYDFPIAPLITKFKYQQQWALGHLLATLLAEQLQQRYANGLLKADYLITVPQAKARLRERGFNQAEMLCKWLSKALTIPVQTNLITRIVDTPPQQQLSAKQRLQNLKKVFAVNSSTDIKNLHLAVVDDVVTTGATANTLAKLLYQAGATRVDIYAVARTPHTFK